MQAADQAQKRNSARKGAPLRAQTGCNPFKTSLGRTGAVYRAVITMDRLHIVQSQRSDWFTWNLHESGFSTAQAAEQRADALNAAQIGKTNQPRDSHG